ncbi:MAG: hypothetical protein JW704_02525 [Anaerolineaceae bacterium]|nr:hypothetical protein [Anaerolineaceae bacterium]
MTFLRSESETYFGREVWTFTYYLLDASLPASSGSYTVSATVTGSTVPYDGCIEVCGFTGVAQSAPPTSASGNNSNPAYDTVAYTTNHTVVSNSGLLLDAGGGEDNGATAQTPGSGQTERRDQNYNSSLLAMSTKPYTSSGANSMAQTPNGQYWSFQHIVIELADSEGASIVGSDGWLANSNTISQSYTCHSGEKRMLLVGAGGELLGGGNVNSVTYNGVALTKVGNTEYDEGANNASWWYLLDANFPSSPGSYTLQVTFSGSYAPGFMTVAECAGVKQSAPEAYNGSSATSSNTINTTITTLTDGAVIFGFLTTGDTGSFTPQSGQTELEDLSGGAGGASAAMGYEIISTAGATNMQWQASSTRNRLVQMVIAVAPFEESLVNVCMIGCNF